MLGLLLRGNMGMFKQAILLSLVAVLSAHADEGIATNTVLSDQLIVAQSKKQSQPVYKSVESPEESSSGGDADYFQGKPPEQMQNVFAGLGYNYVDAFGLQARYAARILENGFIEGLNDPFYLEGGLGLTFYGTVKGTRGVTGFNFVATGRWDFQMDELWTFFANLGFGFNSISAGLKAEDVKGGGFFPAAGVGAMFNLTPEVAVRADLSYQFLGAGLLYRF